VPSITSLFGTRVARRVLASFAVAAIAPLALTAWVVLTNVSSTLEEQSARRLDEVSAAIGQQLIARLLILDDALRQLTAGSPPTESTVFDAVTLERPDGKQVFFGDALDYPALPEEFPSRSLVIVQPGSGDAAVLLARPADGGIVVGRIRPDYLWTAATMLPYAMELCVFTDAGFLVHCTAPLPAEGEASLLAAFDGSSREQLHWTGDEGAVVASRWQLFLPSRFEAVPWQIVVSQPSSIATQALASFHGLFPLIMATSLALSLLLGSIQVRRIMQPLQSLLAGTRRIAERKFSSPVVLSGNNEFTELATAMNEMAGSLDRQFETISALAEIDRLILTSQSITEVVDRIIERASAISPTYGISVLLIDPDQRDRAQINSRVPGHDKKLLRDRISLNSTMVRWLADVASGGMVHAAWLRERIPALPSVVGANSVVVAPIFRADELRGALIAQVPTEKTLAPSDRARLFDLAGRLSVALAASEHEAELFRRGHFDALTGLPNRQLFFDRLHQATAQARREEYKLAILFIDLDRFKSVNDSMGHALGDELLKETAFRLSAAVRETDTVARLGGDEYVVILPHIGGVLDVEAILDKTSSMLARPYQLDGREVSITASIGVAIFPDDAADAESLLQNADTAMYAAKDTGRARVEFFEAEMERSIKERLQMQQELREAFRNREFYLAYQAQLDLVSGKLVCMEALIRWHHPARGAVPPGTFIPILEEMGMIGEVGRWITSTALADYAAWREDGLQLPRMSINFSGQQLVEADLEAFLVQQLAANGLEGENLELELTEHCLVEDFERTNAVMLRLSNHGIRIAIDDFGTGYSSLGYLQRLQFDTLKIDQAFVRGLPSRKSTAIVEAVIGVAKALDKVVIAEGVDSDRKRQTLVELGCNIGQGYLFSVPIPADEVLEWCARLDESSVIEKLVAQNG
jgi:diguanylate cyclase (GGDEF)-like protein